MKHLKPRLTWQSMALVILLAMTATACVPKKKYEAERKGKQAAEEKARKLDRDLANANAKISDLEKQNAQFEKDIAALEQRAKNCEESKEKLNQDLAELRKRNNDMKAEMERYKSSSKSERDQLDAALRKKSEELDAREKSISELLDKLEAREKKLAELQSQLDEREARLVKLQAEADAKEKAAADLQSQLEAREKRIQELEERIAARDKAMNDLRNKLMNALTGYKDDDLSVEVRNGKVYIAISDKMLFKSGSAKVEQAGQEALRKVANVLNKYQDMDLIIEGHTDSLPIKTPQFADNWDLSVIRATSVVRLLTVDYGMSSTRVQAAGRGEFFPKASNSTPEGRSKNRRTEIIIAPKLDLIEEMLTK